MKSIYDLMFMRDNGDGCYNLDYVNARTKRMTGFERIDMRANSKPLNVLRSVQRDRKRIRVPFLWISMVQCTDNAYPFIHKKGAYHL